MRSAHVSRVIAVGPDEVYDFAANPANLAAWAASLAEGQVTQDGVSVHVDSPMGRVGVEMAPRNEHRVLDHEVVLPSGERILNHMRVLSHPDGAEVVFSLRQMGMTDEEFERDRELVEADLDQLKGLLESTF